MNWREDESPLQFGIMFSEAGGQIVENTWYSTEEERNFAFSYILETGTLEIESLISRSARIIEPYAFSIINAAPTFYKKA
jgi:hypothetical protein